MLTKILPVWGSPWRPGFARRSLLLLISLPLIGAATPVATAGMLSPSDFTSLGAMLSESGTYQVNTSTGVMTLPDGGTITGDLSTGVAVFTFNSIDIGNASFAIQGTNPFALLSQGSLTLGGVGMDVSAYGQTPGAGGDLVGIGQGLVGYMSGSGGGGFGTAGGQGGPYVYAGDPHFTPLFGDYVPGGAGGTSYGGLASSIEGGSAGGDFSFGGSPLGSGGAGGGAIELGANRTLSLTGVAISANGGDASGYAAGGGSGGGISLLGAAVYVDASSSLSALGGAGGPVLTIDGPGGALIGGGGYGGEGRIDIQANQASLLGSLNGIIENSVPEPSSIAMLPLGIGFVLVWGRKKTAMRVLGR